MTVLTKPTYTRHIHSSHRAAIREKFEEGFTIQELFIMYRDVLHDSEKIAIRQLRALTRGLERQERV
jgi:hypothetical protein